MTACVIFVENSLIKPPTAKIDTFLRFSGKPSAEFLLSDLARIQVGHSFRKSVLEDADSPFFVLQTRDLLPDGRISENLMRVSTLNEKPKPNLAVGDVVVLSRGVRFNAGVVGELPGPTTAQNMFHIIKLKPEPGILPAFLASFLNTASTQTYLRSLAEGATVQHLRVNDLGGLRIPLPSLEIQRVFCSLTQAVDQEVQLLKKLRDLREIQLSAALGALEARPHSRISDHD